MPAAAVSKSVGAVGAVEAGRCGARQPRGTSQSDDETIHAFGMYRTLGYQRRTNA